MAVLGGRGEGGKAQDVRDEYLYFLMLPGAASVKTQYSIK